MDDSRTGVPGAGRHAADSGAARYRRGDVLMLECPFAEATVAEVSPSYASVRWPWREVDPLAESYRWNGCMALPTPESAEWAWLYFRSEPAAGALNAGDTCLVGIPPTVVHVVSVDHYDPPRVTGMLPRTASSLAVLPQGESPDPDFDEPLFTFDPAGGEPISLQLLFRPYAFLDPGDEVVDRDGRVWRFDTAWDWHPFDGGRPGAPAWPLALLFRDGDPTPEEATRVAAATAAGTHAEERGRWTELTHAKPAGFLSATSPPATIGRRRTATRPGECDQASDLAPPRWAQRP
ncbi:hypothetical protein ABT354_25515 [Streptomyces sp. NPDC000594]|uniref:hypothetical protein n=1 Tax=Streptomyces sp. NPDC000594 TaxID=3154261 RepID=UPI00333302CB